ncbi:hypothetical protein VYU27_006508 [Nannochloropsis oceanica]
MSRSPSLSEGDDDGLNNGGYLSFGGSGLQKHFDRTSSPLSFFSSSYSHSSDISAALYVDVAVPFQVKLRNNEVETILLTVDDDAEVLASNFTQHQHALPPSLQDALAQQLRVRQLDMAREIIKALDQDARAAMRAHVAALEDKSTSAAAATAAAAASTMATIGGVQRDKEEEKEGGKEEGEMDSTENRRVQEAEYQGLETQLIRRSDRIILLEEGASTTAAESQDVVKHLKERLRESEVARGKVAGKLKRTERDARRLEEQVVATMAESKEEASCLEQRLRDAEVERDEMGRRLARREWELRVLQQVDKTHEDTDEGLTMVEEIQKRRHVEAAYGEMSKRLRRKEEQVRWLEGVMASQDFQRKPLKKLRERLREVEEAYSEMSRELMKRDEEVRMLEVRVASQDLELKVLGEVVRRRRSHFHGQARGLGSVLLWREDEEEDVAEREGKQGGEGGSQEGGTRASDSPSSWQKQHATISAIESASCACKSPASQQQKLQHQPPPRVQEKHAAKSVRPHRETRASMSSRSSYSSSSSSSSSSSLSPPPSFASKSYGPDIRRMVHLPHFEEMIEAEEGDETDDIYPIPSERATCPSSTPAAAFIA